MTYYNANRQICKEILIHFSDFFYFFYAREKIYPKRAEFSADKPACGAKNALQKKENGAENPIQNIKRKHKYPYDAPENTAQKAGKSHKKPHRPVLQQKMVQEGTE